MIFNNAEELRSYTPPPKPKINIEKLLEISLPLSPGGLLRIKNMLLDYNTPSQKIGAAISYEPALSARVMRIANSPLYSTGKRITSIPMAVNIVGVRILHEVVLMEISSSTFGKQIRTSELAKRIWEHSLAVAVTAREISKAMELRGTEEAFTCGLLHDMGKMVLLTYDLDGFTAIQDTAADEFTMLAREKQNYGYNHTEVGSLIARRWGLPDYIGYTIMHHHNASQATEVPVMARLIDVADIITNIKGFGLRQEDETKLLFSESAVLLGLSDDLLETIWGRVEEGIWEIIKSFS